MGRRYWIALLLGISVLSAQAAVAQEHDIPKLDLSKTHFDAETIELCHKYISKPLYMALSSSNIEPRLLPAFITAIDYPSNSQVPKFKLIYATDGSLFGGIAIIRRTDDGEWEYVANCKDAPPGHRVKLRLKDLTGDGVEEVIATARGGRPPNEAMMALQFNENDELRPIIDRPKSPYDPRGPIGVAVSVIDSLGRDGCPAVEVWKDDSVHFASRYIRVRQQYDKATGWFHPESIDTLNELPYWCDGRRRGYEPQN